MVETIQVLYKSKGIIPLLFCCLVINMMTTHSLVFVILFLMVLVFEIS